MGLRAIPERALTFKPVTSITLPYAPYKTGGGRILSESFFSIFSLSFSRAASIMGRKNKSLTRVLTSPLRALRRVRDLYVRSITGCAGNGNFRVAAGSGGMPRSYSLNPSRASISSEEDLRELVRAASRGSSIWPSVPRSQSAAIGRIDEDKPCAFNGQDGFEQLSYPRSRSCAIPRTQAWRK